MLDFDELEEIESQLRQVPDVTCDEAPNGKRRADTWKTFARDVVNVVCITSYYYIHLYPICSMYGIFTYIIYIWVIYGVNVGTYSSTMVRICHSAIDDQGIPRQIEPGRLKMAQVKADVHFLICKIPTGFFRCLSKNQWVIVSRYNILQHSTTFYNILLGFLTVEYCR